MEIKIFGFEKYSGNEVGDNIRGRGVVKIFCDSL